MADFEIENKTLIKYVGNAKNVTVPDGITAIGKAAFRDCSSLTSVTLPQSVKTICQDAFRNCRALTDLILPSGIEEISYGAFENVPYFRVPASGMGYFEKDCHEYLWEKAVLGFLHAYYSGKTSEEENGEWRKYTSRRTVKLFRLLPDEPLLYRYLTDRRILSPKRVIPLLEETENPECRAILLDYGKRGKKRSSAEDIIDKKFKL